MKKLTTAQLAEELGMDRTAFVKHRSRYEEKLIEAGYDFIKEGTRQNITYTFNTNEPLSIENLGKRIKRIFNIDTESRNKTMDKYLRFLASKEENYTLETDREIAEQLGEYRSNISQVRYILERAGYFSPLTETHYYKSNTPDIWEEVEAEEWSEVWRDIYYPEKQRLEQEGYKITMANGEEKEGSTHFAAMTLVKQTTGYDWKRRYKRIFNFELRSKLDMYLA